MVTSGVIFAFIGTLLLKFPNSAAIDYEPIKIIVNENFNAQPGQVSSDLQALEPGVLHQGANFYLKPQFLPQSFIPSHIKALMSFIEQHQNSCFKDPSKFAAEKNKLMEILKPFMYPSSDISKETTSKIVFEKENNLEIVKPPEFIPTALEEIVAEPQSVPAIITEEPKPVTKLLVIPEAPVLPQLGSAHSLMKEEVKNDESALLEKQTGVYSTIPEITVRPIQEPIFTYVQTKPITSELVNIPEAPVLPSLSFNGIPSNVKKEIIKEESVVAEAQRGVFPTISGITTRPVQESIINYVEPKPFITELQVIPEAPILPPLSANDIKLVEEGMKIEEPIVVDVESKPAIQELEEVIPEASVLPTLSLHGFPYIVKEEVRKEESELLKEPMGVFPTVSEAALRTVQEPIFNYAEPKPFITELQVIPEVPVLPPFIANDVTHVDEGMKIEEPIVLDVDSKPAIEELEEVIPEAPVLPPLSLHDVPYMVKEEVRKEESELLKEPMAVFPTVSEAVARPVQELIFDYAEPKPFITELQFIPEAPVLPPLSANDITLVEEGMKIEEPVAVDVESTPVIQELEEGIPEAPVLPPLSLYDVSYMVKEEVRKEESELLKEPTAVFPTVSEAALRPIQELIFNYAEPKPFITELQVIPEAPVLPPLSTNGFKPIESGVKIEEPIDIGVDPKLATSELIPETPILFPVSNIPLVKDVLSEEMKTVAESTDRASIPEIFVRPIEPELAIVDIEPKPVKSNHIVIPEAPVLPALSFNGKPSVGEEVKTEELIKIEESTGMLAGNSARPISEPITVLESAKNFVLENNNSAVATKVQKPNNLGVFNYEPFASHLSNRATMVKKLTIPKAASLKRFLLKKHPFRLPTLSFPKLSLNAMKSHIGENKKQFLYPTSYAHDVVEKRIAPNMGFKKYAPRKLERIYIRSQVPKGPSYL